MEPKQNIKLPLTEPEKQKLRQHKFRIRDLQDLAVDEIEALLEVPYARAKELHALACFQLIPSVGIKFAEDLVFLGYYELEELKSQSGAALVEAYERKKGYWIDSCVEDQFRLVVHYANHMHSARKWWDFTAERKAYREANGYPEDRPQTPWYEVVEIKRKKGNVTK